MSSKNLIKKMDMKYFLRIEIFQMGQQKLTANNKYERKVVFSDMIKFK